MKKVKKKVYLNPADMEIIRVGCGPEESQVYEYRYTFTTHSQIPNMETLEHFVEVEEPETLAEFRQQAGITKYDLVEWLNKNYHKSYLG